MALTFGDLKKIRGARILNESFAESGFKKVAIDSRICRKGDLFFAVKGERLDGHDYVKQAFNNGAICSVVNEGWYKGLSENNKRSLKKYSLVLVKSTIKALGLLANIYRRKFLIPIIAVSGSNGKTTAKDYIANVLSKKYKVLKTEGNFNNAFGVPLTLFRLKREHEIAVVEIGTNHFGEVKYLCGIAEPQVGIITNIGKEHLEFLVNIKGAAKAECELLDYLNKNFGMFFLNSDDAVLNKIIQKYKISTFSYGTKNMNDVKGKLMRFEKFNPAVEIKYGNTKFRTTLKGIGSQSFSSALSASAVGFYFEVKPELIKSAITNYQIESGKRNQLKNVKGVWIIDDSYNSNPDSVKAALENMRAYKINGNKYLVLGDMLELGKQSRKEHSEVGRLIKIMKFENLYTFGKESFYTFRAAKGIRNNFHFEDKQVIAEFLKINMKKDDLILIKGSRSMKMEEVIDYLVKHKD